MLEKVSWKKQKQKAKPLIFKKSEKYRKLLEKEWGNLK